MIRKYEFSLVEIKEDNSNREDIIEINGRIYKFEDEGNPSDFNFTRESARQFIESTALKFPYQKQFGFSYIESI